MEEEIKKLKGVIQEKERYIARLKRGTKSYEKIVIEAEHDFVEKLSKQQNEKQLNQNQQQPKT